MIRPIKKVTIEFEDGTIKEVEIPKEQGFYRESYTYSYFEDSKVLQHKLYVHEIHWTLKERLDLASG